MEYLLSDYEQTDLNQFYYIRNKFSRIGGTFSSFYGLDEQLKTRLNNFNGQTIVIDYFSQSTNQLERLRINRIPREKIDYHSLLLDEVFNFRNCWKKELFNEIEDLLMYNQKQQKIASFTSFTRNGMEHTGKSYFINRFSGLFFSKGIHVYNCISKDKMNRNGPPGYRDIPFDISEFPGFVAGLDIFFDLSQPKILFFENLHDDLFTFFQNALNAMSKKNLAKNHVIAINLKD